MEIDKEKKTLSISSKEPFGQLLLEIMHSRSVDERVLRVQRHIGATLVGAYLYSEIDYIQIFGMYKENLIIHEDTARDLAIKAEVHARATDIPIMFYKEHFEGLEQIAMREIRDLPELMAEREIVAVAAEMGYINDSGIMTDDQDLMLIEEEIEQAEASKIVLDTINYLRG